MAAPRIKAVFFDFMGTCLDWHAGTISVFPQAIDKSVRSQLALEWRQSYFDSNKARLRMGQAPEDIDVTLERTLYALTEKHSEYRDLFDHDTIAKCVSQWHSMPAWPEVPDAIAKVKETGMEVFVFANGTTRLQLDLCRSSGLSFNMLFSSALLGIYKPALDSYRRALDLVKLEAGETVQVAAHANDLRGAKKAGMKTIYVKRWTDDIEEDVELVKKEVDYYLDDMSMLSETLAKIQAGL